MHQAVPGPGAQVVFLTVIKYSKKTAYYPQTSIRMTEYEDLKELIAQEQSIVVDFSTFLALFSLFVIFYYIIKWVRRKAAAAVQRDRTDVIYTSEIKISQTKSPKRSEPVVEDEIASSISKKSQQLPYDSLLETQRKQRRKGYSLVDHSTTMKKKDRVVSGRQKKTQLYCPINVEAALGGKNKEQSQ